MKARFLLALVAIVGAALWFGGVPAPPARHILISDALAQPLMDGQIAATLIIDNSGAPDQLLSVSSTFGDTELFNSDAGLPLRTGISSLALDGAHVRFASLDALPEEGALLPLTLTFQNAGDVSVKIRYAAPEPGSMAAHMAMGHSMMQDNGAGPSAPKITLNVSETEAGWVAAIATSNFVFSEELQDGDHVPGTGHGHIYLGGMKLGRVFANIYEIGALPPGQHEVRVTLNTNDHRTYAVDGQPVTASALITVD